MDFHFIISCLYFEIIACSDDESGSGCSLTVNRKGEWLSSVAFTWSLRVISQLEGSLDNSHLLVMASSLYKLLYQSQWIQKCSWSFAFVWYRNFTCKSYHSPSDYSDPSDLLTQCIQMVWYYAHMVAINTLDHIQKRGLNTYIQYLRHSYRLSADQTDVQD